MKSSAEMPNSAPKCNKVKQSSGTMPNQASNTPTQGKGGGAGGGKFKTKHGVNAPMNSEKEIT